MESEAPKQSKLTSSGRFSSTLIQDSSFPPLPEELINEILLKLPVKSLLKFRLILNLNHDNLKDCSVSSLLNGSLTEALDLEYPRKEFRTSVEIVGSVNELICVVIDTRYLYIWNPSIRKFKKVPDCTDLSCFGYHIMYGFGFDELHSDYKVVVGFHMQRRTYSFYVKVKIYSLNSDYWTSIRDFEVGLKRTKSGMFVKGKLLWANDIYHTSCSDIISFDLADKTWGKVEQPYYGEGDFRWTLGVLESDLSVFCYYYRRSHAIVWVLKEYGVKESWMKTFNIIIPFDHINDPNLCLFFCMSNKGEILIQFATTFMIYNPRDQAIIHQSPQVTRYVYKPSIYIESLIWPFCQRKKSRMQLRRRLK